MLINDETEEQAHARIKARLPDSRPAWLVQGIRDAELCATWAIENQFR